MSLDRPRPHSWRSPRVPRRKPRPSWRAVPPLTRIVIPRARRAGGGLRGFAWRFGGPPRGPQLANLEHRARRIGTVAVGAPMASAKSWVTGAPDHYRGGLDYGQEGVDLAVRYGDGKWPGVRAERLFREELFPVCAPKLRDGGPPLEAPEDLGRHTMIHVIGEPENWRMWLQAAGAAAVTSVHGLQFDLHMMSAQAAISGIGVVLGLSPMVADALADGRLVAPFETRIPARDAHFVVTPEDAVDRAEAQAFRAWSIAEARGEGAAEPARRKRGGGT